MPKLGGSGDANKSQLDYIIPTGLSTSPYGTTDTPKMKTKIVGGHLSMVVDDQKLTPRQEPPVEVKFKRNPRGIDFNPDKINTYPMSVYGYKEQDPSKEPITQRDSQPYQNRAAFSPHRVVPPIESPSRESFLPAKKQRLQDHLAYGNKLPRRSVVYSRDEELELKFQIQTEMKDYNKVGLQEVYLALTKYDDQLLDLIDYDQMWFTLFGLRVPISHITYTLIAAQFIHEASGKINYNNVLSYISGALKEQGGSVSHRTRDHQRDSPRKPGYEPAASPQGGQYFNPVTHQMEKVGGTSSKFPNHDHGMAKLLSLLDQELADCDDMLDMEEIWEIFGNADRTYGNRLSAERIKALTFHCKIPIQDGLINRVLEYCQLSNDQYNWRKYLEIIEKVVPVRTGYNLPESKKPTEYVKNVPKPSPNWPNPVEITPSREPDYSTLPKNYVNPQHHRPYEHDRSQSKQSQVDMLESKIQSLENKHKRDMARLLEQKKRAAGEGEPWIERFMKFADAMYKTDRSNDGYLPRKTVQRLIEDYNDTYNLKLSSDKIRQTLHECTTSDGQNVIIDSTLKMLGSKLG